MTRLAALGLLHETNTFNPKVTGIESFPLMPVGVDQSSIVGIITGQQPLITKSKKSIATFKLREDRAIGMKVTLRGEKMWAMLDRLINIALPRVRDFRGVPANLDGRGNYTIGLREQLMFAEIQYDKIDKVRGMEITIVTTAKTDEEGRRLLALMGMPFQKN